MRDYSQAAQTWRARPPVEPEEEAPADEETGSLGGHSAHSGKAQINDHTINTTVSDLTSVREGETSTVGVEDSLLADSYEQQQQLQQSRQDDQYADDEGDDDDDVLDPAELEMLNEEAERMKGIGNRHMANQVRLGHILWQCLLSVVASFVLIVLWRDLNRSIKIYVSTASELRGYGQQPHVMIT